MNRSHSALDGQRRPVGRLPTALVAAIALGLAACGGIVKDGGTVGDETQRAGAAQIDRGEFPYQGEQMFYTIRHVGLDLEVLDLAIAVGYESEAEDGTPYIPIAGVAESISIARFFAEVDDSAETFIDPRTWQPHYAVKDLHENDHHRSYFVWYWFDEMHASVEKFKDNKVHKREVALPVETVDAVSWLYHMRQMPLVEGQQGSWFVFDGWTISRITCVVREPESIWTPMGFFDTHRVDVYREKMQSHWPQGALSGLYVRPELDVTKERYFFANMWLRTDDHLPVRMGVGSRIGDIEIQLTGYLPPGSPSI